MVPRLREFACFTRGSPHIANTSCTMYAPLVPGVDTVDHTISAHWPSVVSSALRKSTQRGRQMSMRTHYECFFHACRARPDFPNQGRHFQTWWIVATRRWIAKRCTMHVVKLVRCWSFFSSPFVAATVNVSNVSIWQRQGASQVELIHSDSFSHVSKCEESKVRPFQAPCQVRKRHNSIAQNLLLLAWHLLLQ